jgi:thiamine biosynthesis protein ThiC
VDDKLKQELLAHLEDLAAKYDVQFDFSDDYRPGIYDMSDNRIFEGLIGKPQYWQKPGALYVGK